MFRQIDKKGTFRLKQNLQYVLRDKNGKVKPLWNENAVARWFREVLGASLPRIPALFGFWRLSLDIHNLVVSAGKAGTASRINGAGAEAAFTYIAIGTASQPTWAATTAYALGNRVVPTTANGFYYECTTAGTSAATQPTWPTVIGNTVVDGTVTWTCKGGTSANAGDTTLMSEITTGGGARAAATASRVTTTVTNDTAQLLLTFNFTASFAVTESGALNASSAGTLLARQVFSAINVANGDSLQVTWKFQAS